MFLQTDKNGCTTFTVKTKTLELNESDSYLYVRGEIEETGTGTGGHVKSSNPCRQLFISLFDFFFFFGFGFCAAVEFLLKGIHEESSLVFYHA